MPHSLSCHCGIYSTKYNVPLLQLMYQSIKATFKPLYLKQIEEWTGQTEHAKLVQKFHRTQAIHKIQDTWHEVFQACKIPDRQHLHPHIMYVS
jgi:hypothetical protein